MKLSMSLLVVFLTLGVNEEPVKQSQVEIASLSSCANYCVQAVSYQISCFLGSGYSCLQAQIYLALCAACQGSGGSPCLNPCPGGGSTEASAYSCESSGGYVVGSPDCNDGGCGNSSSCVCCQWN